MHILGWKVSQILYISLYKSLVKDKSLNIAYVKGNENWERKNE